jgi:hypothetical protein
MEPLCRNLSVIVSRQNKTNKNVETRYIHQSKFHPSILLYSIKHLREVEDTKVTTTNNVEITILVRLRLYATRLCNGWWGFLPCCPT